MGMAILGPSPPYEYPVNQLLYDIGKRSKEQEREVLDDGREAVQDGQMAKQNQSHVDKDVLADVVNERIQEHT